MSDDLRLRTALALGWVLVDFGPREGGGRWERYEWLDTGLVRYIDYRQDGSASLGGMMALPLYGTTWASCEEIDAAIKEREWTYRHESFGNGDMVVIDPGIAAGRYSVADAPTFPEAFAEAFCWAAEGEP